MRFLKTLLPSFIPAPWDLWSWFNLALPFIASTIVTGLGYMDGIPWSGIFMYATIVFMSVTVGLVMFTIWRTMNRVEDKLNFLQVRCGVPGEESGYVLGFLLKSSAHFPLSCDILSISSRLDNMVPSQEVILPKRYEVPPEGFVFFDDFKIDFNPAGRGSVEGFVDFEIAYNKKGIDPKFKIKDKKKVALFFNKDGVLTGSSWQNA